jgi:hypothetical protein
MGMKKFVALFALAAMFIGCASLGSLLGSGGESSSSSGNSLSSGSRSSGSNGSRVKTARPASERNDKSKTDAELVAEAIKWGDCAFLYDYTQKEGADKQLVSQANATIKKYADLDGGIGKYRTNKMDARVRQVPKEVMEKVFADPAANLPEVVSVLTKGLSDQFAKAKVLHDWLCDNIAYDAEMYFSGRVTSQDYVSIIKKKKAVCSGYTNAFNKMCELSGIESIGINGYSKGVGYTGKIGRDTDHAWNAVHIGSKWYLVDVTWDAGPLERRTFIKHYSTAWLFLDSRPFLYSHLPDEEAYQFYAPVLTADDFMREAYITGKFFQYGLALKSEDPEYTNIIDGGFTFDLAMKNSNVSVMTGLYASNGREISAASWSERKSSTITIDFDVPDTADYNGYLFARYNNVENPQFKISIAEFEGDVLPKAEALFVKDKPKESKITEKELEYFKNSYFKVQDNGEYYFAEDQFDTARNNAVLKVHKLIELSTGELEQVLSVKIKAAPGYAGFGQGVLKYPYTFSTYNQLANTQLIFPITGTLKAGSTETFVVSSKDYSSFAIIINKEFNFFTKNSKTGNFELEFTVPPDVQTIQISGGTAKTATHWGLVRYNVVQ